ncbi:MAG: energy-coupling factor ABC transporter ATP-binding protein [Aliivibrio sp.]|uniref:energy-coupling factor ABC transporter ATP-binding protein n=1 Tax=Aliivibrio sp. TaxID=1872443 RepID=UPI001A617C90|nr:energy-coupling factor ABC transporter ATP-binding protein [Aliivibrio sp.]
MTVKIIAQDLSISFNKRLLFHIPTLSLGPKEAVYLRGPNGAGKTTLLKILSGLIQPTTGHLNTQRPHWFRRLCGTAANNQITYLHQTPFLFDGTVYDNVNYGLKCASMPRQQRRNEVINALRLVGLETLAQEHISVLSGGERQRVAMARAWVLKPAILLMDEPSASVDKASIDLLVVLAKDLLSRGASLIITSHQTNALTDLCHRQWTIDESALIETANLHIINDSTVALKDSNVSTTA